ncbi:uncharacterized protein LOC114532580 [Dendronephthya gigantea]|uniref:uncharacterized protein LOC114532580 n=1 Tax=Dendronephthya gigantea TaxID=151771 RepID=UPI00106A2354|nr:uncharacterized protein LOC114532580 [Dendronephthya gigantea]
MELFPLKLYKISRFFFFVIIVVQGFLLSKYLVDHEQSENLFGVAVGFIVISLFSWVGALSYGGLKKRLGLVWLFYILALVTMMGWIYGLVLIDHNKLREEEIYTSSICNDSAKSSMYSNHSESFFDSKFLKITLCLTPGEMVLLLTSVTDKSGALEFLHLTTVLDLFDGIEMIEVLHEDVCDKIPEGWEVAVLIAALLFFLFSPFEISQIKFVKNESNENEDEPKPCKKTMKVNTVCQIVLNFAFLVIRLVLWLKYDFDSAVFIAKNFISLAIALVSVFEKLGFITTEEDEVNS